MISILQENRTANSILEYFENNFFLFVPALTSRVNIQDYVDKIHRNALQFWAIERQKNEIAGFMACYFNDFDNRTGFITTISVRKDYQGFGIGKRLLSEAIVYALELNFIKLVLDVYKTNDRAIELYKKNGFRAFEITRNNIRMVKLLNNF